MAAPTIPTDQHDLKSWMQQQDVAFVDLRFTDSRGKEQHMTICADAFDETVFTDGKLFDGSSIAGWKGIKDSDMTLLPDLHAAYLDPFTSDKTLNITCDVLEPSTMMGYGRCPRALAKRAEAYLKSSGLADACLIGPEPEFFLFDDVKWRVDMNEVMFQVDSEEAAWNTKTHYDGGNMGHRPGVKRGYIPVPPVDSSMDIRSSMCRVLKSVGLHPEVHHHEVATANQCEIGFRFNTLMAKADEIQRFKYVVHNVAHQFGKTATFMPKPLAGDNGSGMHCHISLSQGGNNLFSGESYAGLSETALFFIGGVIKHAKALNAFTNPSTNSYKRLVPGFEAPVMLAYSARNRSASIRIPVASAKGRRIEVRFPDPLANPYLAFSAILMAGIDGIKHKVHPGDPMDKDLYDLPPEEKSNIATVATHLQDALDNLRMDMDFLLQGEVFSHDLINAYIALKETEVQRVLMTPHPAEFDMYYSD